jgi:hypothetical protein
MDLINALPCSGSVNMVQQSTTEQRGLCNSQVNIFQHMHHATIEEAVFSMWSHHQHYRGRVFYAVHAEAI